MDDPYANINVPYIVKSHARKLVCRVFSGDWAGWDTRAEILLGQMKWAEEKGDYHVPSGFINMFQNEIIRLFNFLEPMNPPLNNIEDMENEILKIRGTK